MKRLIDLLIVVATVVLIVIATVGLYQFGVGVHLQPDVQAAPLARYAQGPSSALVSAHAGGQISTNVVSTLTLVGEYHWLMCGNNSSSGIQVYTKLNDYVSLTEKDFIIYYQRSPFPTCGGDGAIEITHVTVLPYSAVVTPTDITTDVWCVVW